MTPASRLPVEPGERVLDMCAAPGGKATELGARLQGRGILVANDISSSRARALLKNLELTGLANFYVTSEEPETLREKLPEFFHKVLIDAPCSGEGMFHKEPKMARYWEEKPPAYYAQIQKRLILQGADLLMPGGMLLYSTCTFSQLENEEVIAWLLKKRPDMEVIEAAPYQGFTPGFSLAGEEEEINRQISRCIRIFPPENERRGTFRRSFEKEGGERRDMPGLPDFRDRTRPRQKTGFRYSPLCLGIFGADFPGPIPGMVPDREGQGLFSPGRSPSS